MRTGTKGFYLTAGLKRYLDAVRSEKDALRWTTAIVQKLQFYLNKMREEPIDLRQVRVVLEGLMEWQRRQNPQDVAKISCKAKCSACCHIRVEVTEDEMRDVMDVPIDEEKLKRQAASSHDVDAYESLPYSDKLCVFNKDNNCSIYERRPVACRLHNVAGDPKECDTRFNPKGTVLNYQFNEAELFSSAYYHHNYERGTIGSLPEILKRVKEKKT